MSEPKFKPCDYAYLVRNINVCPTCGHADECAVLCVSLVIVLASTQYTSGTVYYCGTIGANQKIKAFERDLFATETEANAELQTRKDAMDVQIREACV